MTTIMLVFSDAVAGREADYDEWYEHTHLPELLALPGFVAAQRWGRAENAPAGQAPSPRGNLAIYELEGDGEKGLAAMMEAATSGAMHMSDALDLTSVMLWVFNEHGARQVAAPRARPPSTRQPSAHHRGVLTSCRRGGCHPSPST